MTLTMTYQFYYVFYSFNKDSALKLESAVATSFGEQMMMRIGPFDAAEADYHVSDIKGFEGIDRVFKWPVGESVLCHTP